MNFWFSISRFCIFSTVKHPGVKVYKCAWGGGRALGRAGALVLVPGLCSNLPQVLIRSLSLFIVKLARDSPRYSHFNFPKCNSPQTAQSSSLRKLHSLVQPIHFSVVRSLVTWRTRINRGLCLEIPALVQPSAPDRLPEWQEIQGSNWKQGKGQEQNTAAHLVLQQQAWNMVFWQLKGRWQETWEQGT